MLLTTALFAAMLGADVESPVSALDAVDVAAVARLPEYFSQPDPLFQVLFDLPVARVNGQIVTAEKLLIRYVEYLAEVNAQVSSVEFSSIVHELIQRDLPQTIQFVVVEQSMIETLPPKELADMRHALELQWQRRLLPLAREMEGHDLENPLPVSLDSIRQAFARQALVQNYLWSQAGSAEVIVKQFVQDILDEAMIETAYIVTKEVSKP